MNYNTPLQKACNKIVSEKYHEYYDLLSNILLLNANYIKDNDPRLTAKVTAILFDERDFDKVNLICQLIENDEFNSDFMEFEIKNMKKLLDLDEMLTNTLKIIDILKHESIHKEFKEKIKLYISEEGNRQIDGAGVYRVQLGRV